MAVISKEISASLRLKDADEKTAATFNGVDSAVPADNFNTFTLAVSALRVKPINSQYLVINTELIEEPEDDEA